MNGYLKFCWRYSKKLWRSERWMKGHHVNVAGGWGPHQFGMFGWPTDLQSYAKLGRIVVAPRRTGFFRCCVFFVLLFGVTRSLKCQFISWSLSRRFYFIFLLLFFSDDVVANVLQCLLPLVTLCGWFCGWSW